MDPVVLEVALLCLGVFVIMKVVLKVQYYSHFQLFIFHPKMEQSRMINYPINPIGTLSTKQHI